MFPTARSAVIVADDPALAEPLADRYATVIAEAARECGAKTVLGTSSTFSKDVLPRAAALLDAPMVTDVVAIEEMNGSIAYRRPINAGSMFATVKVEGDRRVLTVRATAFEPPAADAAPCPIERFDFDAASLPNGMQFISREERKSDRPDLTEARVVVSGGRPLKDKETFERLVGGLADALGGAIGATRAAVDAGMAPNDYQIGQTGKVVAPELYIALGISGAIQHLAGIKDSRIIVAINKDPDAPIFQMATYALVGDLHQIVPQLHRIDPASQSRNAMTDMNNATREVFGNIAPWMRVVFFIMIAASIAVLAWQVAARVWLWRKGQRGGFERDWRVWSRRLVEYALAQKRVHRKSLGALLHLLLFSGFVVLTIGTTLLAIAYDGPYDFHHGWYYLIYELTMDVFGVAFIIGCLLAMYRRAFRRKPSLGHNWRDWWLLGCFFRSVSPGSRWKHFGFITPRCSRIWRTGRSSAG